MPLEPGENRPPATVSIKYALEAVPIYDGSNIPLAHFLEGCEEACNMLPADVEECLTSVVRNKLRGEARRAIQGVKYTTIKGLSDFLKSIYAPAKTIYQLQGDLGRIYQSENEGALAYANRVRDLGNRILDVYKSNHNGVADKTFTDSLDKDLVDCFIRGLKTEIENKMTDEGKLSDVMLRAIEIERKLQAKMALRGVRSSKHGEIPANTYSSPRYSAKTDYKPVHHIQESNIVICQICQKQGHTADKCWHRQGDSNPKRQNFDNRQRDNNPRRQDFNFRQRDYNPKRQDLDNRQSNFNPRRQDFDNRRGNYNPNRQHFDDGRDFNSGRQNFDARPRNFNMGQQGFRAGQEMSRQIESPRNNGFSRRDDFPINSGPEMFCRYCKERDHVIENCQKRVYYNRLTEDQKQVPQRMPQGHSENWRNLSRADAPREKSGIPTRPVLHIQPEEEIRTLQE